MFLEFLFLQYLCLILMSMSKCHTCSNHSNLEMEAKCLTKNLPCLNLNISRTKNGINKLKEVLEQGRVIEYTYNFPSKVDDFQHLPHFCSIRQALWMQIFVFFWPMWCQEQSGLSDSRTFQPQGVKWKKTQEKIWNFGL